MSNEASRTFEVIGPREQLPSDNPAMAMPPYLKLLHRKLIHITIKWTHKFQKENVTDLKMDEEIKP